MGPVVPTEFTPWLSLFGGVLIGLSAVMVMGLFGKIAGITGITKGLTTAIPGTGGPNDRGWRLSFLIGLVAAQADPETGKANEALAAKRDGTGRVHVLCASGARAALAADSLRQMGYDTAVIEGGLAGWKDAGLPLRA
jgi:rhodanese-related sulfurtransferase